MRFAQRALASCVLLASPPVAAQENLLSGPLAAAAAPAKIRDAVPAQLEWSYWASGGASYLDGGRLVPAAGIGAELTFGAITYVGLPAGSIYGPRLGRAELRVGPWIGAATHAGGSLLEGGVKIHLGAVYHASLGTFDLRFGSGYGEHPDGRSPLGSLTFAYGVRSALGRYSVREHDEAPPLPKTSGLASVARLFITYRRGFDKEASQEIMLGIELTPLFLLPPYSWFRLAGGPPR